MVMPMKNYYEVLEISESASQEVIDRVYKLFAKKYHPDLNPDNPEEAEEKFKEITEAYEILSDSDKRKSYDNKLQAIRLQEKESSKVSENTEYYARPSSQNVDVNYKNIETKANKENEHNNGFQNEVDLYNQITMLNMQKLQQEREYQIKKAYNDAYVDALKSMGIKVVYKKTFKEKLQAIRNVMIFLLILCIVALVAWQMPEVRMQCEKLIEMFPIKKI